MNTGTVSATNPVGFPDANTNIVTTALDTLALGVNDVNKDGLFNAGDSGVNGVTLSLFVDANNDSIIDNEASPLATTTTAAAGSTTSLG